MATLIIYYSQTGNTKVLAEQIQKDLNCDIFAVESKKEYKGSYGKTVMQVGWELLTKKPSDVEAIPDITLDIYGKGGAEKDLSDQIERLKATSYIRLMGQQDLTDIYVNYEGYLSASTSEGFGLTLMEAIGSGLPIIGFDVRYGNQNFIDHNKNGYKLPYNNGMERGRRQKNMVDAIIKLCTEADITAFEKHSYKMAENYLANEVENRWKKLISQMI